VAESATVYDLRSVRFAYQSQTVIHGVDLQIQQGEFVALLGPNGAGKSTLLRLMLGQLNPEAGQVRLFNRPLASLPARLRAQRVAYLPQRVPVVFPFTVEQVVMMGRYPYSRGLGLETSTDRDIAHRCARQMEIEHLLDRSWETLSGGEQQRVLLTSILAQEPEVVLLDEPTSALDPHHQVEVFGLLTSLVRQGRTLVLATHDLNGAARFCSRLCLLDGGHLRADGMASDIIAPELLRDVYGDGLRVIADPDTQVPIVLPALQEELACA
jgi:iron complex transport system ATP-binding protein